MMLLRALLDFFFFNDTATTEIYTLSLHDALPICPGWIGVVVVLSAASMTYGNIAALAQRNFKRMLAYSSIAHAGYMLVGVAADRKSTRLNSSHDQISYAVFCLKNNKSGDTLRHII